MKKHLLLPLLCSFSAASAAPPDATAATAWDVNAAHGATHSAALSLREGTWMSTTVHGDRLVFDLLGDLWSMPLSGGQATRLTEGASWDCEPRFSPDGARIAYVSDAGGNENIWVMNADGSDRRALTEALDARFTDPVWDPSGPWIIARRRTVDTRSIGVTELWQIHLDGGGGFALTSKDQHPHAGEAALFGDDLYFSSRAGRFEYDANPVGGLWSIQRLDRRTGEIRPVVDGAGSAARPLLSPDGKKLVFLSRDREKTLLELLDLGTGRRRVLADWLSPDQLEGFALHGTYPSLSWTGDGQVVLWAGGRLWRLGLDGSRAEIPFQAEGTWTFHDVPRWQRPVPDELHSQLLRWAVWSTDGRVALSALGALWLRAPDGSLSRLSEGTGYAPAWSPDGAALAWTSWDDQAGGRLHITRGKKTETLPVEGQLVNPSWSVDGRSLVALRGVGGSLSPDLNAESYFEIILLTPGQKRGTWDIQVVTTTENAGPGNRGTRLLYRDGRVWYQESRPSGEPRTPANTALVSVKLDGTDKRDHLIFPGAGEVVPSPDLRQVAIRWKQHIWVTALPAWGKTVTVSESNLPLLKLADEPGGWVAWTPDGAAVTWVSGDQLKRREITTLRAPKQPDDAEKPATPPSDAEQGVLSTPVDLRVPRAKPSGTVAYTHATVLTMRGDEVITDGTVVVQGDRIQSVTAGGPAPAGATVVDLTGKTMIPGLVDVHAHGNYSADDVLPQQEWRYQTLLDFGVTTMQDPSASTDLVFTQSEEVSAGFMKGPRIYSTGEVLYGALDNESAVTPDAEAALGHVRRMKAVGALSVKVYQQSQRQQRQWFAVACRAEQILCVAEGGGDLWQDLSMVADGFHAVEHSLSVGPLYADVRGFIAASHTAETLGTANSATLLVAYGGLSGEHWYYQHATPLYDERLLRHYPRRLLDARAWRLPVAAQDQDWFFQTVARDQAALLRDGALITLGAHGQLQGLGTHWELWGLAGPGAMSPAEALRAATINGARYLGLDSQIGSVEAGKLADLIVLDASPLEDIHNSVKISFVLKNGERFD